MSKILILYSTTDGHTLKICQRLQQVIERSGINVNVISMDDAGSVPLEQFDKIVIGASIRYGRHKQQVIDFINRNEQLLERKPSAFFSVNVVARKANKNTPETNPYFRKFLRQIHWRPRVSAVFAGRINYAIYSFVDRNMIRLIMWITHGPTDPNTNIEFTDWQQVEAFAETLATL